MKVQVSFLFERFQEYLAEILLNIFSSKSFCDVRLIGEDEIPVMAHRVILAAFSSVFNDVMQNNTVQTLNIKIRGMDYCDIQTIVQFMYLGEASVAHSGVDKFLRAAKFLGVSQLSDQCKAAAAELSREFSIECVDSNEVDEEKIMEEAPDYLRSTNADLDNQDTRDSDLEAMEGENLDEYGIRIEEDNLKIEVNDDRMVDEESFVSNVILAVSLLGVSLPTFVIGILFIYLFAVILGILPSFGRGEVVDLGFWTTGFLTISGLKAIILPSVTLSLFQMTYIIRLVRAEMMEILETDYIKFARARGINENSIKYKHALKNGLIPVITIAGINIGTLIAFSIITETVFQWPGMGFLFIQAVQFVDIPIMSAYLVFIAFVFVMINFIVDILYYFIDPRIRVKGDVSSG